MGIGVPIGWVEIIILSGNLDFMNLPAVLFGVPVIEDTSVAELIADGFVFRVVFIIGC